MVGNKDSGSRDRNRIEQLCRSGHSVSTKYAEDPQKSPGEIAEELYGSHASRLISWGICILTNTRE